jgi:hypothetical protein
LRGIITISFYIWKLLLLIIKLFMKKIINFGGAVAFIFFVFLAVFGLHISQVKAAPRAEVIYSNVSNINSSTSYSKGFMLNQNGEKEATRSDTVRSYTYNFTNDVGGIATSHLQVFNEPIGYGNSNGSGIYKFDKNHIVTSVTTIPANSEPNIVGEPLPEGFPSESNMKGSLECYGLQEEGEAFTHETLKYTRNSSAKLHFTADDKYLYKVTLGISAISYTCSDQKDVAQIVEDKYSDYKTTKTISNGENIDVTPNFKDKLYQYNIYITNIEKTNQLAPAPSGSPTSNTNTAETTLTPRKSSIWQTFASFFTGSSPEAQSASFEARINATSPLPRLIALSSSSSTEVVLAKFDLKSFATTTYLRKIMIAVPVENADRYKFYREFKLDIGGIKYTTTNFGSLVVIFDNLNVPLIKDAYVTATLSAVVNPNINNQFTGAVVTPSLSSDQVEVYDAYGKRTPTNSTIITASKATFTNDSGVVVSGVSATSQPIMGTDGAAIAEAVTFKYIITAGNDTIYVPMTLFSASGISVAVATTTSGTVSPNYTGLTTYIPSPASLPGDSATSGTGGPYYYVIPAGSSRTFTLTGKIDYRKQPYGPKTLQITGIKYGTMTSALTANTITAGIDALKVSTVGGDGNASTTSFNQVKLNNLPSTTLYKNKANAISWSGGSGKVLLGVIDYEVGVEGAPVGWITLNGAASSSAVWNAYTVTDLSGSTVYELAKLAAGPYKLIAVSANAKGTYCVKSTTEVCNVSVSSQVYNIVTPTTTASIQVVSPNGGEIFYVGQKYTFTWKNNNAPAYLQARLVGSTGYVVEMYPRLANVGQTSFIIPTSTPAGKYKFSLYSGEVDLGDTSDNYFTIATAPAPSGSVVPVTLAPQITSDGLSYKVMVGQSFGKIFVSNISPVWSVIKGTLPPGLSLSRFGTYSAQISGIPTTAGNYSFVLSATDPADATRSANVAVYITVLSQTVTCPAGYTCTPAGTAASCPSGYTCTTVTTNCPTGYTCFSKTLSSSPSPSATYSPSPTYSPTPTYTTTPTYSPTPTTSSSPTPTYTSSPNPTATYSPTPTTSSSPSPTYSSSPSSSSSPSPSGSGVSYGGYSPNFAAAIFYAVGDLLDTVF